MSFARLVSKLNKTKINEALIINEILKNSNKIILGQILLKDISEIVHISHSTVSRFIQKLGYANWNAFVQSCVIEDLMSKKNNKFGGGILDKMNLQRVYINSWWLSHKQTIQEVVKKINSSKLILLYGSRISGNVAQNTSFLFNVKNKANIHFFQENQLISFLKNDTLLIIFTTSRTTNYQDLIDLAYKKGTKVIILDSSDEDFIYANTNLHIKLPLVTYFDKQSMQYLKSENLREFMVRIWEYI